jgi:hypothetical protein
MEVPVVSKEAWLELPTSVKPLARKKATYWPHWMFELTGSLQPGGPVKTGLNDVALFFQSLANVFRLFPVIFHQENAHVQVPLN